MASKNKIIMTELKKWLEDGSISSDIYSKLSAQYDKQAWDLAIVIRWTLIIGAVLLGIGGVSWLVLIFKSLNFLAFILTLIVAAGFAAGQLLTSPKFKYYLPRTGNAIIILACLFLGSDIFTLAGILFPKGNNWPSLLLVISALYFIIAYWKKNSVVLVMGLLLMATWFGSESGYLSGWGAYYLGLNYPLRFALVSPLVILVGFAHKKILPSLDINFSKVYYAIGLLYTNLALWILSIFGNRDNIVFGSRDYRLELLMYSGLWFLADAAFFAIGSKFKNKMFTGFGLVFIILNLYTRYFEYFWSDWDKWIFFIVLGALTITTGIVLEKTNKRKKTTLPSK